MSAHPTQTYTGMQLGAEDSVGGNRVYVNLRLGEIAITSREQFEGSSPAQTKSKDGKTTSFYARRKHHITGFISDIYWKTSTLPDGTVLSGWNVAIETGAETYVLYVAKNDRTYAQLMNTLLAVDFDKPIMFRGFYGTNKRSNKKEKVLLLSQELDPTTKKPIWLKPVVEMKWMSRLLGQKLKEGIQLTEQEEHNVSRMQDQSPNRVYPYIIEKADGTWSFERFEEHLYEQMLEFVIPNVKAAVEKRGTFVPVGDNGDEIPEHASGVGPLPEDDDDEIPF